MRLEERLNQVKAELKALKQKSFSELSNDEKQNRRVLKDEEAWLEDAISRRSSMAVKLRADSGLGVRFANRTFDTFNSEEQQDAYNIALEYAKDFCDASSKTKNSLLFIGSCGTGKTHLAAAIANYVVDCYGYPVIFGTWAGHLNTIKAGYDSGYAFEYIKRMIYTPLLIIDDFGKEKPTEWAKEILFEVINGRYEANLPVVITTNLNWKNITEHMDEAIQSRLIEICQSVAMNGKDYREND